jgi:hypothetical protein
MLCRLEAFLWHRYWLGGRLPLRCLLFRFLIEWLCLVLHLVALSLA